MGVAEAVRNPATYTRERVRMYRRLLFDPGRFYEEHVGNRGLRTEILLVALIGAVGTVGSLYTVLVVRSNFETGSISNELPRGVEFQLWAEAIAPLVGAFVLWIAFSILLYLVSWVYSDEGGIFPLLKKTAWSLVPLVFTNVVLTIGYVYTAMNTEIDTEFMLAGGTTDRRFNALWEPIATSTELVGARVIGLVFLVWVGYIAAHAVADVRDLDASEGYRVAAVVVLAYVAWTGYQLLALV